MSWSLVRLAAAACIAFSHGVQAQASTTTTPVPTGTPVPGDYTGPLRPQVHFSPPQHFMNDPNGLFKDANGTWHMYYQYNPTGVVAGNQHWGHATSRDLYTWVNEPIALFPVNASSYIFSGSAVIDTNNTSGFFPNQDNGVVAFYTIATYEPILLQSQGLAVSYDGGYTFTPYEGNPIIDVGSSQFRDPHVIRYGDHWVMTVSYAIDFVISFYTSTDLKNWTHASNFTRHGYLGYQYECPNLVRVPIEDSPGESTWLLQISINPKAPQGGSFAEYFLGDFDGYTFTPSDPVTRFSEFGKDSYAGAFFYGTGDEAVTVNWASNWQYTQQVPTGTLEGWRSAMSLPRKISLRSDVRTGLQQVARPYDLTPVLGDELASQTFGNGSVVVDYSNVYSNAVYLDVNVTNVPTANLSGSLNYTFLSPVSGEYLRGGYFFGGDSYFWQDRGGVKGFDNVFFSEKVATNQLLNGTFNMQIVIDRSVLEAFVLDGLQASTNTFFPKEPLTILSVSTGDLPPGNMTTSVRINALKSSWQPQADSSGIVQGNTTMASAGMNSTNSSRLHSRMLYKPAF